MAVLKVKTLDYMIFRKLREKLKSYFEKPNNKAYEKLFKRYTEDATELIKEFKPERELQEYIEIGKRAFEYCQGESKQVVKFVNTNYVGFLEIIENKNITKQRFLEIVKEHKNGDQVLENKEGSEG